MSNKQQIIFRADGNSNIGLGHVVRSLAVADMIKGDFDCVFAIKEPTESLQENILNVCSGIIPLKNAEGEKEFIECLPKNAIVMLDGLFFDTNVQQGVKDKNCKLVCIDDLHQWHFVADVIVNQDGDITEADYSTEPYTKLFFGLDYAMLRKPFLEAAKKDRKAKPVTDVLITFGGSDFYNLTLKALHACDRVNANIRLHIITGAAYQHIKTLSTFNSKHNLIFYSQIDAATMCRLMEECQLIICSASSVCIEALSTHMPIITGYYAENQKAFSESLKRKQYAEVLGDLLEISIEDMGNAIAKAIKKSPEVIKDKIIDGQQNTRYINLFKSLQ